MDKKQEKKRREQYLHLATSKMLYITSGAAERLGQRLNIYESGDITVLKSEPLGEYHLARKSSACSGKNLCAEQVVEFLAQKYSLKVGDRLPVWWSEELNEGNEVYCGTLKNEQDASQCELKKIELLYNRRVGTWAYIEDNCLSFKLPPGTALPRRLSVYGKNDVLALLGDDNGEYTIEFRKRKGAAVYSGHLTQFICRWYDKEQRGVRLHGKLVPNGICFSVREEALEEIDVNTCFSKVNIGKEKNKFISLSKSKIVYCSSQAANVLGSNCALYSYRDEMLALRPERKGGIKVIRSGGYSRWLSHPKLYSKIKAFYPNDKKLILLEHGDLFILTAYADIERSRLPSPTKFHLLQREMICLPVQKEPLRTKLLETSLAYAVDGSKRAENR